MPDKEKQMQKSAQYQAALEILIEVLQDISPADNIINNYLKVRKYIGSKDRKVITETVWGVIRNRLKLEFDCKSFKIASKDSTVASSRSISHSPTS